MMSDLGPHSEDEDNSSRDFFPAEEAKSARTHKDHLNLPINEIETLTVKDDNKVENEPSTVLPSNDDKKKDQSVFVLSQDDSVVEENRASWLLNGEADFDAPNEFLDSTSKPSHEPDFCASNEFLD